MEYTPQDGDITIQIAPRTENLIGIIQWCFCKWRKFAVHRKTLLFRMRIFIAKMEFHFFHICRQGCFSH